jgi:DNA-binding CsgD family transcriptional regulator/PAS domain-containing protein
MEFAQIWEARNRTLVQIAGGTMAASIALVDWWTKPYVSLGFLYLFPIMLVAAFVPRWVVVLFAASCAVLAEVFSSLDPPSLVRLGFEALALAGCGLFVAELVRNRRLTMEAEARLKALVETSPAAIVTVDENGFIEIANQSAVDLMAPRDGILTGAPIAAFLPELHHALQLGAVHNEAAPRFKTSMQCHGHKGNEESFTADVWFSTYGQGASRKLAAIVANVADEPPPATALAPVNGHEPIAMSSRELGALRLLIEGLANKEIAARMEVSESTIKNTLQQLFAKTNVRTRAQLVRIACEHYRDYPAPTPAKSEARRMLSARKRSESRSSWSGQPA